MLTVKRRCWFTGYPAGGGAFHVVHFDSIVRALDAYWDARGLSVEAAAWADRILDATVGLSQAPPGPASPSNPVSAVLPVSEEVHYPVPVTFRVCELAFQERDRGA